MECPCFFVADLGLLTLLSRDCMVMYWSTDCLSFSRSSSSDMFFVGFPKIEMFKNENKCNYIKKTVSRLMYKPSLLSIVPGIVEGHSDTWIESFF